MTMADCTCHLSVNAFFLYRVTFERQSSGLDGADADAVMPSVLSCCWLGSRKGIRPVKN